MLKLNSKTLNCQRGFSLVEILVGVAMLGGLSVAVMNMTKQQSKLSTKSQIDGDVAEVSARILNALNSPRFCDVNFNGRAIAGTLPSLQLIGATHTLGTAAGSTWNPTSAANVTPRLRLNTATYNVTDATPVSGNPRSLALLSLVVNFESKYLELERKTFAKTFTATVIVTGTGTILGCPKTWNSTVRHGE